MTTETMPQPRKKVLTLVLGLGFFWWFLDQLTKYLAVSRLTRLMPEEAGLFERLKLYLGTSDIQYLAKAPVTVLDPVWEHLYVQNPAGAFSFLLGMPPMVRRSIFLLAGVLATAGIVYLALRNPTASRWRVLVPLGVLLGGALGNFTDRAFHGYVIDFIHWHYGTYSWPPFNIADACIVIGVAVLLIFGGDILGAGDKEKAGKKGKGGKARA
ncbi:MAG: signal peptidase II [Deltaproteobacteria bacterium]|nr:signal peptidase II [Deltaproteobacteria bacterium]